jgi:hypothetical protein
MIKRYHIIEDLDKYQYPCLNIKEWELGAWCKWEDVKSFGLRAFIGGGASLLCDGLDTDKTIGELFEEWLELYFEGKCESAEDYFKDIKHA